MSCNCEGDFLVRTGRLRAKASFVFLAALSVFIQPAALLAQENDPAVTVNRAVEKMKQTGSLSALIDYIDWDFRYSEIAHEERQARGISSAKALRAHYLQRAEANGREIIERLQREAESAPPEYRRSLAGSLTKVKEELRRQEEEFSRALQATDYVVQDVKFESDTKATVSIERRNGAAIKTVTLTLHRGDGSWLMESAAALNPLPIISEGTPVGRLPEPVAVLGQP